MASRSPRARRAGSPLRRAGRAAPGHQHQHPAGDRAVRQPVSGHVHRARTASPAHRGRRAAADRVRECQHAAFDEGRRSRARDRAPRRDRCIAGTDRRAAARGERAAGIRLRIVRPGARRGAVRAFASTTGELGLPAWTRFELDGRVFAFAALVCLGTGLLFGCAPALHLSRRVTPLALRDGGRGLAGAARPGLWMRLLLATQVALAPCAFCLMPFAYLRARALYAADHAVDPAGVLTARVALPAARYADSDARERLVAALRDRWRPSPASRRPESPAPCRSWAPAPPGSISREQKARPTMVRRSAPSASRATIFRL